MRDNKSKPLQVSILQKFQNLFSGVAGTRLNIARPCRSMIYEIFLRLVNGSVDGFGNRRSLDIR